jgi:hypothetical protein
MAAMQPPVTATDVGTAVALVRQRFADVADDAWDAPAGGLAWTCWETVEHMADDLFAYAAQLAPAEPPLTREVPIVFAAQRPEGPASSIFVRRDAGTAGLLQALEACGAFLVELVRAAPADRRAYHVYGVSDAEGFAAMGVVEVLVHAQDIALGLRRDWAPPPQLCARALARLFPDAPVGHDPWATLLWCTGRGELPDLPVRGRWRWDGTPRAGS